MAAPVYAFENGLRKVRPYYLLHKTHIKTRWEGRTIIDVFTRELGQQEEIVCQELKSNMIYVMENFGKHDKTRFVEGWDALKDRKIAKHDVVYSKRHMHEPSVVVDASFKPGEKCSFQIVYEDVDLLVVNKPSGVPTHPTANYRYNSAIEILKFELQIDDLWPCHRLDKVTSGVLIFGKNKDAAKRVMSLIEKKGDSATKTYVARVKGKFPEQELMLNCPIFLINASGGYLMPSNLESLPADSCTKFRLLAYSAELDQSVVECVPVSGKMHQIRIHLRNLGFPIVNDFVYSTNLTAINELKNATELYIYDKLYQRYPQYRGLSELCHIHNTSVNVQALVDEKVEANLQSIRELAAKRLESYKNAETCHECSRALFDLERNKKDACIWLHSYKYELNANTNLCFETEMPAWCNI